MMKAYVVTTGTLFGLIAAAHVLEIFDRGRVFASDALVILLSSALVVWAWRVARPRPGVHVDDI